MPRYSVAAIAIRLTTLTTRTNRLPLACECEITAVVAPGINNNATMHDNTTTASTIRIGVCTLTLSNTLPVKVLWVNCFRQSCRDDYVLSNCGGFCRVSDPLDFSVP